MNFELTMEDFTIIQNALHYYKKSEKRGNFQSFDDERINKLRERTSYIHERRTFSIEDVHLLYHCVCKRLENWEGSPARPAEEQEHLWDLKNSLYKIVLDHKYHDM